MFIFGIWRLNNGINEILMSASFGSARMDSCKLKPAASCMEGICVKRKRCLHKTVMESKYLGQSYYCVSKGSRVFIIFQLSAQHIQGNEDNIYLKVLFVSVTISFKIMLKQDPLFDNIGD